MPTLITMSELQGTTIATQALNQAISNTLSENQTYIDDLLRYDYNEAGELISWNVNAIVINQICAQIVSESMDALENIGTLYLPVPLGQLTGNKFLANTGPRLKIRVLPLGTVEANYENDICSTGINQVNHTVWLNVEATVQVVVPLFTNQVKVQRRVVLVDKVISGTVPPTYLNISEGSVWSDLTGTTSKKE
jgi:sporulation protein YunB